MINVLIEPGRINFWSSFWFLTAVVPIIAAWLAPIPGNKEQIGETIIVVRVGLMRSDFIIGMFLIFCSGIFVLVFIDVIKIEVPKSPVRSGRIGSLIFEFSVENPRIPARIKIKIAFVLHLSFKINRIEIQIRKNASIFSMKG